MKEKIIAAIAGLLFGLGLALAQMTDPVRVLGFLDVTGQWDPTLIFVLGGAVGVTLITFRLVLRRYAPFWTPEFRLPTKSDIDQPLIVGSALFGVGWGIAGYCPGPGITALGQGLWNPVLFVVAMAVGSVLHKWIATRQNWMLDRGRRAQAQTAASDALSQNI